MRPWMLGFVLLFVVSCGSDGAAGGVEAVSQAQNETPSETEVPTEPGADTADAAQAPTITFEDTEDSEEVDEATEEPTEPEQVGDGLFPTVVAATASARDDATWLVNVTLSSEYDSPARYADAWRVLDADDNELGIRVLAHDHAGEQPFTRSTSVDIPTDITTVFIEGRDQINGWSGERFELTLTP